MELESLARPPIIMREILVDGAHILYERGDDSSNIDSLARHMETIRKRSWQRGRRMRRS